MRIDGLCRTRRARFGLLQNIGNSGHPDVNAAVRQYPLREFRMRADCLRPEATEVVRKGLRRPEFAVRGIYDFNILFAIHL